MKRFIDIQKGDNIYMYNRLNQQMVIFNVTSVEEEKYDYIKISLENDMEESVIFINKKQYKSTLAKLDNNIIFSTQPIQ